MEKQIIKEFLKAGNEQDKDEYIRDLSNSICVYVKTGNKNELLDNFLIYAIEIKSEIKQTIAEKEKIGDTILESVYMQSENGKSGSLSKQVVNKWEDYMKKIMYLSHLNMLYELYTREMQLKEEQTTYIEASKEFPKLFSIATEINKQRRISNDKLIEQFSLSDMEYNFIMVKYKKYFNFRRDRNKKVVQISLSPTGKNYLLYMRDTKTGISQAQVNLIVRNCEAVIKSIPVSLAKRMPQRVEFCGIMPESERSLQLTYDQMIFEVKRMERLPYPIYDLSERKCYSNDKEKYNFPQQFIK